MSLGEMGAASGEHLGDGFVREHRAGVAHLSLEEEGHGRAVHLLIVVITGHLRDLAAFPRVPADDGGEDVEEVRGHRDDAFAVRHVAVPIRHSRAGRNAPHSCQPGDQAERRAQLLGREVRRRRQSV